MNIQAYNGVNAAQHQTNFNKWFAQGYRIISLSVYGDPGNALYAAVWVQRSGPAWEAVHNVNAAGYQTFFNTWTAKGYAPVLISVTGSGSNLVFAGVFEQGISGASAEFGMTNGSDTAAGTFQHFDKQARNNGAMLRSVSIYGTPSDRRFAAVWHPNPTYVKCHLHPADPSASFQTTFNAETALPGFSLAGYRASYIALSADNTVCSVYTDDVVGAWSARVGMSSSEYQTEFNKQFANGFYPTCTQGGGTTSSPIYAAIFAKQDIPSARQMTVTGNAVASLAKVDQIMEAFMKTNGVRAAQVAIGKGGVMKFSRAYTWAEPGYRITQPADRFLLASCSKLFLEAAVQSLYDSTNPKLKLLPTANVYPLLGFTHPADPRSDTITIQQLLDHTGGYDDSSAGSNFDPTYHMREIALSLGLNHPVAKLDVARYMYGKPLDYTPYNLTATSGYKYSNFGFLLAAAVVEHVTSQTYYNYLNATLLHPLGLTEVKPISTLASGRTNDEAIAEDQGLGLSPLNLTSQLQIPCVYGGDGEINEVGDANDGMGSSAEAMATFINHHAAWGNGPRAQSARAGSTPGASSWAESRSDGIDWAYTLNTRDWPPSAPAKVLDNLDSAIDTFLNTATLP
ncbi:MAG TPA: serine hydrolase [Acidobacteriaceae bacterium]|jgi:CubicO group peptidase (beta-lactamase class C family)